MVGYNNPEASIYKLTAKYNNPREVDISLCKLQVCRDYLSFFDQKIVTTPKQLRRASDREANLVTQHIAVEYISFFERFIQPTGKWLLNLYKSSNTKCNISKQWMGLQNIYSSSRKYHSQYKLAEQNDSKWLYKHYFSESIIGNRSLLDQRIYFKLVLPKVDEENMWKISWSKVK